MSEKKLESRFGIQRKIVADTTRQSWQNIPHVSYIFESDVSILMEKTLEFQKSLPPEKHITFNTVVLKAISEALKAAPQLNAHLHFEPKLVRGKITLFDRIDISMPWILPNGEMMTINMKDMGSRSLGNIYEYITEMGGKIKKTNLQEVMYDVSMHDTMKALQKGKVLRVMQRLIGSKTSKNHRVTPLKGEEKKQYESIPTTEKLTLDDLKQGTITVSNIGSITREYPGTVALLMIIPPQVCAIAIGAVQKKPVVITDENGEDKITVAKILPLDICFDHRALDFGDIKPFMARLQDIFNNPESILKY